MIDKFDKDGLRLVCGCREDECVELCPSCNNKEAKAKLQGLNAERKLPKPEGAEEEK